MRIDGEWFECEDGVTRPVVEADVLGVTRQKQTDRFLIDTGADRSVFSAAFLHRLRIPHDTPDAGRALFGIGGGTGSVLVNAAIEFIRDDGVPILVRGAFAAFTDPRASDLSILGRDVLDNFDVILSRRRAEVLLLAPNHHYQVMRA